MEIENIFRLQTDGAAISADTFFGVASNIVLTTNTVYEYEFDIWLTKTENGNVVFSLISSQAPNNVVGQIVGNNDVAADTGSTVAGGFIAGNTTSIDIPAVGINDGCVCCYKIFGIYESNQTNNSTLNLYADVTAGTITPSRGSNYRIKAVSSGNVGIFV